MTRKLRYVNGHYQLPLLWKNDAVGLPPSQDMALKRLDSLRKRLLKNPVLQEKCSLQMQKMIDRVHLTLKASAPNFLQISCVAKKA